MPLLGYKLGAEAFHFARAIAPIGAYMRPLSIYHREIVRCGTRAAPTGLDLDDETLNTRLCGSIIMPPECGIPR